jgi:hypothetical protein
LSIREYEDPSNFLACNQSPYLISKNDKYNKLGYTFFKKRIKGDEYEKLKNLIKNDIIMIDIFFRFYKIDDIYETYIDELKSHITKRKYGKRNIVKSGNYYEWVIDDWNKINDWIFSPVFNVGGYRWVLSLNIDKSGFISLNLKNLENFPFNGDDSINIKCNFGFRNINNFSLYRIKPLSIFNAYHSFNKVVDSFLIRNYINESELFNTNNKVNKSIIENNKVIISIYLYLYKVNIPKEHNLNYLRENQNSNNMTFVENNIKADIEIYNENENVDKNEDQNINENTNENEKRKGKRRRRRRRQKEIRNETEKETEKETEQDKDKENNNDNGKENEDNNQNGNENGNQNENGIGIGQGNGNTNEKEGENNNKTEQEQEIINNNKNLNNNLNEKENGNGNEIEKEDKKENNIENEYVGNEFENASASASAIDIINSKKYQTENGFDIRDDISIKNKSFQIVLEKKNSENDESETLINEDDHQKQINEINNTNVNEDESHESDITKLDRNNDENENMENETNDETNKNVDKNKLNKNDPKELNDRIEMERNEVTSKNENKNKLDEPSISERSETLKNQQKKMNMIDNNKVNKNKFQKIGNDDRMENEENEITDKNDDYDFIRREIKNFNELINKKVIGNKLCNDSLKELNIIHEAIQRMNTLEFEKGRRDKIIEANKLYKHKKEDENNNDIDDVNDYHNNNNTINYSSNLRYDRHIAKKRRKMGKERTINKRGNKREYGIKKYDDEYQYENEYDDGDDDYNNEYNDKYNNVYDEYDENEDEDEEEVEDNDNNVIIIDDEENNNLNLERDGINQGGDYVISLYDFKGNNPHQLDISKNEKLKVVDWNVKDGWLYGYSVGNSQNKGFFPKLFVRRCYEEEEEVERGELVIALYDYKSNNTHELSFRKNEKLRILDWNAKEGWVYGYSSGSSHLKGLFPKLYIKPLNIYKVKNDKLAVAIYDFKSYNKNELDIFKGDKLVITHYNIRNGWHYGYKASNPEIRGYFPKLVINQS